MAFTTYRFSYLVCNDGLCLSRRTACPWVVFLKNNTQASKLWSTVVLKLPTFFSFLFFLISRAVWCWCGHWLTDILAYLINCDNENFVRVFKKHACHLNLSQMFTYSLYLHFSILILWSNANGLLVWWKCTGIGTHIVVILPCIFKSVLGRELTMLYWNTFIHSFPTTSSLRSLHSKGRVHSGAFAVNCFVV